MGGNHDVRNGGSVRLNDDTGVSRRKAAKAHAPSPRQPAMTPRRPLTKNESSWEKRCAKVTPDQHSAWKEPENRPDPIDLLPASDAERLPELVPIRYGRMLHSPFAFYRGSVAVMAADLSVTPNTGIHVQACGDCRLMNFGGFPNPERNILFGIGDFDETLPAPWEWDVKQLAGSFVLAARSIGLSAERDHDVLKAAVRKGSITAHQEA
jgi:hypothetical protein